MWSVATGPWPVALLAVGMSAAALLRTFGAGSGGCEAGKHKLEARYSERPAGNLNITAFEGDLGGLKTLMTNRVYVGDVCVRCGRTFAHPTEN